MSELTKSVANSGKKYRPLRIIEMIKSVSVNGLKSLKDFRLDLKPGLNVLVGPNGSGKTNILTAFELISKLNHLDNLDSNDSVGATVVEKLFDKFEANSEISLHIEGESQDTIEYKDTNSEFVDKTALMKYSYGCTLKYDPKLKYPLFFERQNIDVEITLDDHDQKLSLDYYDKRVQKFDIDDEITKIFSISHILNDSEIDKLSNEEYKSMSTSIFLTLVNRMEWEYSSILYELSVPSHLFRNAVNELGSINIFDVDPKIVKTEMSRITSPKINKFGDGLLSTLLNIYEFANGKRVVTFDNYSLNLNYIEIFSEIKYSLMKISPQIKDIEIFLENGNGSKKIFGSIIFEDGRKLSIDLLSDGSLKWLTLVTALLTNEGLFILEEPENYFHPTMQQLLIELMRESTEGSEKSILFTTHSETILDMINPEEVILTYFHNGYTVTKKIDEPEKLNKAIHDTGFGLGWYFVSGEFDYENVIEH